MSWLKDTWKKTQEVSGHVIDSTTGAIKTGAKETAEFTQKIAEEGGKVLEKGFKELQKSGALDKLGNLGGKMVRSITGSVGDEFKGFSKDQLKNIAIRTAAGDPSALAGVVANVAIGAIEDGTGQKVPGDVKKILSGKVLDSASKEVLQRLEKETGVKLPKGTLKTLTQVARGNYMGAVMDGTKVLPEGVADAVKTIQKLKGGGFTAKDLRDNLTRDQVKAIQKRLGLDDNGVAGDGMLKAVKGLVNKLEASGVDVKDMDIKDLPKLVKDNSGLISQFKPSAEGVEAAAKAAGKDAVNEVKNAAVQEAKEAGGNWFKTTFGFGD